MRKYYWYISIFFRKHGAIIIGSIIAAILLFSLAFPVLSRIFEFKKRTYIGVVGRYSFEFLPPQIQNEMSSGLTKIEPDFSVTQDLAERWNTEDDGKTYRFLLKKNIVWQDGKPFVPSDVNYNFSDVQTIITPNEVVFKLKDPFVPFPSIVSQPLFRTVDEPYLFFFKKKRIIGIGKNEVVDFKETGTELDELVINETDQQKIYRFYGTEDEAIAAFKRGEVDVVPDLASAYGLSDWPNVNVTKRLDTSTYLAVFFDTHDDTLRSNEVRQALNYALPKPTDETRAIGPINPKSWAFANVAKRYDFDEQRAIDRILSANGMPHKPIQIELTTPSQFDGDAEKIKKAWEDFGQLAYQACLSNSSIKDKTLCPNTQIHVNVKINNFPDTTNFQALLVGQQIPVDPDQYALWHSSPPTNFTHYKNIRIDSLLEKGRQTEDRKKRFEIYSQFQEFFSEDAPAIFMKYLYKYDIARKGK